MINPWVLLGVVLLWLASLAGVGKWQREDGATAVRAEYAKRDNAALTEANRKLKEAEDRERALEAARSAEMTTLAINYAKGFNDAEARRRRDVAAARDGALVLRIPASACRDAGGGQEGSAGRPASAGDGAATVELPRTVTANLFDLANDADQVADQLRACQQIIINDRKENAP